jgi:hypothetical protein
MMERPRQIVMKADWKDCCSCPQHHSYCWLTCVPCRRLGEDLLKMGIEPDMTDPEIREQLNR